MKVKGKGTLTIVIGIICFVLIAVMFMQFKTIQETDITSIEMMRESELRTEMASWKTKYQEIAQQLEETNAKIEEYETKKANNQETSELLNKELQQANLLLGKTDVVGEGIIVTLRDNELSDGEIIKIELEDIIQLLNELRLAGAEAISINGVRVINTTDVALINNSFLVVDKHKISSPYIVKAIGKQSYLESGLTQKDSGYIDKVISKYDKIAEVERSKNIEIPKYDGEMNIKYIESGDGE